MEYEENIIQTIKKRLLAMPPEISFSIGSYGDFTRDELITEVEKRSEIGKEIVEMQLNFIRKMPSLLKTRA
ncbi:MAG: hypothetical protein AABX04_02775 [Nanoarchaeota archaeon]